MIANIPDHNRAAIRAAVREGFIHGMFQHEREVILFLEWFLTTLDNDRIGTVIEIGAHRGGTSALFCELGAKVISVDLPDGPWGGIGKASAEARDAELKKVYVDRYIPLHADSQLPETRELVRFNLAGKRADLLFVDGDHSYLGSKHDFENYSDFVRPGGVVAFHDINDTALHRDRGVMVSKLWKELAARLPSQEFSIQDQWGGIGAVRV